MRIKSNRVPQTLCALCVPLRALCGSISSLKRLLIVLAPLVALTSALYAHHILGIPHYKYSDEYPQIPYLEVIAQVGSTDLDFTYFPGIPRPGEAVRFKLYIRDRHSGEVFRQPLKVEVVQLHFLKGAQPVAEPFTIRTGTGPERNDYKFFLTFQAPEAYEVRVHFPNGEDVEVIPFPVVIGKTDDRPLIFAAAGILGIAIVSVAAVKKKQRRSRRRRS